MLHGGMTAATRLPSGRRESRIGFCSEISSPSRRAMFLTATICRCKVGVCVRTKCQIVDTAQHYPSRSPSHGRIVGCRSHADLLQPSDYGSLGVIHFASSFLKMAPPFITNFTFCSSLMSFRGSPLTATRSAHFPASTVPAVSLQPNSSAATRVPV